LEKKVTCHWKFSLVSDGVGIFSKGLCVYSTTGSKGNGSPSMNVAANSGISQ